MTNQMHQNKYKQVLVTPELAAEWLQRNPNNRDFKDNIAKNYAQLMTRGEFSQSSPIPISFDEKNNLLDGQHRLQAVIISGKSVCMTIAENVPAENFKIIDRGTKRTPGDIFKMSGIENSKICAAIIQKFLSGKKLSGKRQAGTDSSDNYRMFSMDDLLAEYKKRPDYWMHVIEFVNKSHKSFGGFLDPSLLGAWYAITSDIHEADASRYFNALTSGLGFTSEKDPVLQFRNYLVKNKETKHIKTVIASNRYALFVKSWNMFRDKKLKTLTYQPTTEQYPVLK